MKFTTNVDKLWPQYSANWKIMHLTKHVKVELVNLATNCHYIHIHSSFFLFHEFGNFETIHGSMSRYKCTCKISSKNMTICDLDKKTGYKRIANELYSRKFIFLQVTASHIC
jgi:hypothetical protein